MQGIVGHISTGFFYSCIITRNLKDDASVRHDTADHGWDYRRYIVASLNTSIPPINTTRKRPTTTLKSELAYTTNKISASFSNYSAWHYRTKLMEKILADLTGHEKEKVLDHG